MCCGGCVYCGRGVRFSLVWLYWCGVAMVVLVWLGLVFVVDCCYLFGGLLVLFTCVRCGFG